MGGGSGRMGEGQACCALEKSLIAKGWSGPSGSNSGFSPPRGISKLAVGTDIASR